MVAVVIGVMMSITQRQTSDYWTVAIAATKSKNKKLQTKNWQYKWRHKMKPWPDVDLEICGNAELVAQVVQAYNVHSSLLLRQKLQDAQRACEEAALEIARIKSLPWDRGNHE